MYAGLSIYILNINWSYTIPFARRTQISLKESASSQRNLEAQLMNNRSSDSGKDFRIKDLEGSKRALEKENELLRKKVGGTCASPSLYEHRALKITPRF